MKKPLIIVYCCLLSASIFAQFKFESGYFIANNGDKTECFIRDVDWKDNPIEFEYKMTESSEIQVHSIKKIKSFAVGESKYERYMVKIDQSSDKVHEMTEKSSPEFEMKVLFLRVLVEGSATLYYYENDELRRFFFSQNDAIPQQLVYKRFILKDAQNNKKIGVNTGYKQQLFNALVCENINRKNTNVKYRRGEMVNIFIKYNECKGGNYDAPTRNFDVIHASIRPGINLSSLKSEYIDPLRTIDFGSMLGARLGLEIELVAPFKKGNWAIFTEPTFQYFRRMGISIADLESYMDYKSISLPVGARYAYFLSEDTKLYAKLGYSFDFPFASSFTITDITDDTLTMSVNTNNCYELGLGIRHKRWGIELQHQSSRFLTIRNPYRRSPYRQKSLVFSYQLF